MTAHRLLVICQSLKRHTNLPYYCSGYEEDWWKCWIVNEFAQDTESVYKVTMPVFKELSSKIIQTTEMKDNSNLSTRSNWRSTYWMPAAWAYFIDTCGSLFSWKLNSMVHKSSNIQGKEILQSTVTAETRHLPKRWGGQ